MEWYWALATLIGMVMLFMAMGVPVAMTFITTNIIGALIFMGDWAAWTQIVDNSTSLLTRFTLGPVPMFIMMGSLFFHTGLAIRVFDGLDVLFGRLPGRLCYLTVAGGAVFSTLTGSSMANTAMLGSLMVPEMQRRGYNRRMSMGPILGTGGLAMIIPPSALGVLLASVANIDVGSLLIAGFLPGFLLAGLYAIEATVKVGAMVFFIIMSSTVFSQLLAFSGASAGLLEWATGFGISKYWILLMMFFILITLGMFMDATSMMLITVPIFFPLAQQLGFDLIWFGLFVLMTFEMAGTTPPFGLLLYVMLGVAPKGTTLFQVASAAFPYLICDAILIMILIFFPGLALWLPSLM